MNDIIKLKKNKFEFEFQFSICTIVNDMNEYLIMKQSFEENGFTKDCEYIIADNTVENEFDAYESISHFLKVANGLYVLVVHQDIRVKDNVEKLKSCLLELTNKDAAWAVCGNAGSRGYHESILHISYDSHKDLTDELPIKVNSLDENFLIIRKSSNMTVSPNLKGFHLYGTDLCIIAHFLGYNCYVIEFMVQHLSKGNIGSLKIYENVFVMQYGDKMKLGYIQTTCTQFYLSNSKKLNKFLNMPPIFFIVKQFQRYPYLLKSFKKKTAVKTYVKN